MEVCCLTNRCLFTTSIPSGNQNSLSAWKVNPTTKNYGPRNLDQFEWLDPVNRVVLLKQSPPGPLLLYGVENASTQKLISTTTGCKTFAILPSKKYILYGDNTNGIQLHQVFSNPWITKYKNTYNTNSPVVAITCFAKLENIFGCVDENGEVTITDMYSKRNHILADKLNDSKVVSLSTSPVSKERLATGHAEGGKVCIWDLSQACVSHSYYALHNVMQKVSEIRFSPVNESLFITSSTDPKINIVDMRHQRPLHTLQINPGNNCLDFHDNGNVFFIGTSSGDLHLYDLRFIPNQCNSPFTVTKSAITAVRFRSNIGKYMQMEEHESGDNDFSIRTQNSTVQSTMDFNEHLNTSSFALSDTSTVLPDNTLQETTNLENCPPIPNILTMSEMNKSYKDAVQDVESSACAPIQKPSETSDDTLLRVSDALDYLLEQKISKLRQQLSFDVIKQLHITEHNLKNWLSVQLSENKRLEEENRRLKRENAFLKMAN